MGPRLLLGELGLFFFFNSYLNETDIKALVLVVF